MSTAAWLMLIGGGILEFVVLSYLARRQLKEYFKARKLMQERINQLEHLEQIVKDREAVIKDMSKVCNDLNKVCNDFNKVSRNVPGPFMVPPKVEVDENDLQTIIRMANNGTLK